ncbi:MAG: DUF3025 domain-containing protein [Burkholderiales bacterium]|nr:DUF3025 domain-containing protein [Burkholderiales bacterium]
MAGASCAEALNSCAAMPVRFVPQAALPGGMAYEQYIFEQRGVPTRDGLHDFFNGIIWQHFPLAKQRLNQLQAAQIAADGVQAVRGPVRDAITVFDENAALLRAPDAVWEALVARDWRRLFIELRPLWAQASLLLFGHALLEKLVSPRKPITAQSGLLRRCPGVPPAAGRCASRIILRPVNQMATGDGDFPRPRLDFHHPALTICAIGPRVTGCCRRKA